LQKRTDSAGFTHNDSIPDEGSIAPYSLTLKQ
jgi:hypothetical protein